MHGGFVDKITSRKREIFKDTGIYTLSSYGAQLFDIVNGVLVRRFLGPANMGIWAFLQVILSYANHSALGVTMGTARDVPYLRGKGEMAKAEEVQNLVFTFTLATAVLVSLGVIVFALANHARYSRLLFHGLLFAAALIIFQRLYNLFILLLRAHKKFAIAGAVNFFSSVSGVLLTVLLTWKFKLYGFFSGLMVNYLLMIFFIQKKTSLRFSLFFALKPLRSLLSLGGAILISDALRTVLMSIDRIMITRFLGFEALGVYSIALMAGNYLYSLPNMLGIIFFPHFQEVLAERDHLPDLGKFLMEPTLCLAYLFPCSIGLVWVFSAWFIPLILPQYVEGITAMKYMSLGAFFLALTHPFSMFIVTIRKQWKLIPLQSANIAFGFMVTGLAIRQGGGVEGVALAGVLISAVYFLTLSVVSLREIYSWKEVGALYLKVFLSFVYFSGVLYLLSCSPWFLGWGVFGFLLEYSAFLLFMIPLFFLAEKELGILSTLWRLGKPWLTRIAGKIRRAEAGEPKNG